MASVFKKSETAQKWSYKVKLPNGAWQRYVGYTDKRATESKAAQHQAMIERGEVGLVDLFGAAKSKSLAKHIGDYINDLKGKGRDNVYVDNSRRFLTKIAGDCHWNCTTDITADSLMRWRNGFDRSPKTKNTYVITAKSFCKWLVQHGRLASSPLVVVGLVEQRGREVRIRRALTDLEIVRLLEVSGKYRLAYLMALTTGLRRGELSALRWGDIHLEALRPFVAVRASISKNHKMSTLFLRSDVVKAIQAARPEDAKPEDKVFLVPGRKRFYTHLRLAEIPKKDSQGRIVDFHALRHTFITALSRAGIQPRVAMELARHSQIDLTMRVYTDAGLIGTADAVAALPDWSGQSTGSMLPFKPQKQGKKIKKHA